MDGDHSVNHSAPTDLRQERRVKRSPENGRVAIALVAVLLGLGGLGLYCASSDRSVPPELPARRAELDVSRGAPPAPRLPPTQPSANAPNRELEGLSRGAEQGLTSALAAPSSEQSMDELGHPHPITPRHRRIFEENSRLGAMDGAMDQGDFAALRRMNAEYARDYPEDDHDRQEGYALIADCLEERTPQAIEAARRFWQTHRASTLRRFVRRHCLEPRTGDDAVVRHAPE
jgi:hypothetical protein